MGQISTQQIKFDARQDIENLREGALLVRLLMRTETINRLKKLGKEDEASAIEREQMKRNLEYAAAFKKGYDFSALYFFKSDDSQLIRDGKLDEIIFLNANLEPDETIKVKEKHVFTAEFGNIKQNKDREHSGYILEKDSTGVVKKKTYYGPPNFGFPAIVIMNDQFKQLEKPFPYYMRYSDGFSFYRPTPLGAVKKLNTKLYQNL